MSVSVCLSVVLPCIPVMDIVVQCMTVLYTTVKVHKVHYCAMCNEVQYNTEQLSAVKLRHHIISSPVVSGNRPGQSSKKSCLLKIYFAVHCIAKHYSIVQYGLVK